MKHLARLAQLVLAALLCALAGAVAAAGPASPPASSPPPDPALEARVNTLAAELRCLVCQNQSLADSHADLALDLKNQVRDQLAAGRSERQVIDYMTERYGDFVLYRPPLRTSTVLLWAGPALLLLAGAALLWRTLRQAQGRAPERAVDAADEARAQALLDTADEPR